MILLDTDHLTVLRYPEHARSAGLRMRLHAVTTEDIATTVISLEEQARGWLADIGRHRDVAEQVMDYEKLTALVRFFKDWEIVPFDHRAAEEFGRLRKARVRIGTPDLKIAAIAQIHNALLLSANLRDFAKVPGLRVENWLE